MFFLFRRQRNNRTAPTKLLKYHLGKTGRKIVRDTTPPHLIYPYTRQQATKPTNVEMLHNSNTEGVEKLFCKTATHSAIFDYIFVTKKQHGKSY